MSFHPKMLQIPPIRSDFDLRHASRPADRVRARQKHRKVTAHGAVHAFPYSSMGWTSVSSHSPLRVSVTVQDCGRTIPRPLPEKSVQAAGYTQIMEHPSFETKRKRHPAQMTFGTDPCGYHSRFRIAYWIVFSYSGVPSGRLTKVTYSRNSPSLRMPSFSHSLCEGRLSSSV